MTFLLNRVRIELRSTYRYRGVEIDVSDLHSEVKRGIARGGFERGTITHLDEFLPPDEPVIELGAGIGIVSAYVDAVQREGVGEVVVEPNERIIDALETTRRLNEASFDIEAAAYSPDDSPVELSLGAAYWGASTESSVGAETTTVAGTSLRTLVDRYGFDTFALVTNAEGAEYRLLYDEMELLSDRCELLIVGFHDIDGWSIENTVEHVENNGFELVGIEGNKKYAFRPRS